MRDRLLSLGADGLTIPDGQANGHHRIPMIRVSPEARIDR
jgi:hypothetical protein